MPMLSIVRTTGSAVMSGEAEQTSSVRPEDLTRSERVEHEPTDDRERALRGLLDPRDLPRGAVGDRSRGPRGAAVERPPELAVVHLQRYGGHAVRIARIDGERPPRCTERRRDLLPGVVVGVVDLHGRRHAVAGVVEGDDEPTIDDLALGRHGRRAAEILDHPPRRSRVVTPVHAGAGHADVDTAGCLPVPAHEHHARLILRRLADLTDRHHVRGHLHEGLPTVPALPEPFPAGAEEDVIGISGIDAEPLTELAVLLVAGDEEALLAGRPGDAAVAAAQDPSGPGRRFAVSRVEVGSAGDVHHRRIGRAEGDALDLIVAGMSVGVGHAGAGEELPPLADVGIPAIGAADVGAGHAHVGFGGVEHDTRHEAPGPHPKRVPHVSVAGFDKVLALAHGWFGLFRRPSLLRGAGVVGIPGASGRDQRPDDGDRRDGSHPSSPPPDLEHLRSHLRLTPGSTTIAGCLGSAPLSMRGRPAGVAPRSRRGSPSDGTIPRRNRRASSVPDPAIVNRRRDTGVSVGPTCAVRRPDGYRRCVVTDR